MHRPSSPMAGNSEWARKSASPPARCMRAGLWASNSSPPSSTACAVRGRSGLESHSALNAEQKSLAHIGCRYLCMTPVEKGMDVCLFGGSFNPPHGGHALVAEIALRRLALDQLWWIVTPGNPLKARRELAPLAERIRLSEGLAADPRIKVTAFEARY